MCRLRPAGVGDGRHDVPGHAHAAHRLVSGHVGGHQSVDRDERVGAATGARLRQLPDGLGVAPQLRRAMVRPGRDRLAGRVEVDETFVGGLEDGISGRGAVKKVLIAVAAEDVGRGIGRNSIAAGAERVSQQPPGIHRRRGRAREPGPHRRLGRLRPRRGARLPAPHHDYQRPSRARRTSSLPRVHLVVSLLKRWLLGTHQGAVSPAHLDYYLDEFTFRFNRRRSRYRGKLFHRRPSRPSRCHRFHIKISSSTPDGVVAATTRCRGYLSQADNQLTSISPSTHGISSRLPPRPLRRDRPHRRGGHGTGLSGHRYQAGPAGGAQWAGR